MSVERYLKYFHTVRYLKAEQIIGRVTRRFKKVNSSPVVGLVAREPVQPFTPVRLNKRSMYDDNRFVFLNEAGTLTDWNDPQRSKLWLYNLHYFDDLNSVDAPSRSDKQTALIERWINENPPTAGNGWEPYPISLRIVNWVKWLLVNGHPTAKQLESLGLQAKVLSQTLETHLLGNHLFANAKALLVAGLYFEGKEADSWLELSLRVLEKEIPEQILEDGGNFELTPMYHATITADLLDMLSVIEAYQDDRCKTIAKDIRLRLPRMLQWLEIMSHPDGYVSLFNDSATDIAPTLSQLTQAAKHYDLMPLPIVNQQLTHLGASGYFRLDLEDAVVIGDVGKVGPDYIPGHAHADTLSFELSVFGHRLIVNSGTSIYGTSNERLRQRGTAAHSTVIVNGENSSEVWGGFRVARRAKPIGLQCDEHTRLVRCSHDGYKRLPGKPVHTREWHYSERSLRVIDRLSGDFQSAEARYHLHPAWNCELDGDVLVCRRDEQLVRIQIKSGCARLESSTYHPEFGSRIDNAVLVVTLNDPMAEVFVHW